MTDPGGFTADLNLSDAYCPILIDTARRVRTESIARLHLAPDTLPAIG
jgi:hypothetical protein